MSTRFETGVDTDFASWFASRRSRYASQGTRSPWIPLQSQSRSTQLWEDASRLRPVCRRCWSYLSSINEKPRSWVSRTNIRTVSGRKDGKFVSCLAFSSIAASISFFGRIASIARLLDPTPSGRLCPTSRVRVLIENEPCSRPDTNRGTPKPE